MKRKTLIALIMVAIMALGTISVFALDYAVPAEAMTVTARFFMAEPDAPEDAGEAFTMVSEDGELVIHVTEDTIVYFEDFVPLGDDEEDGMTQMAREVLFGRTLAEVLEGRNLRVIYVEGEENEAVSIMILFETAVHPGPEPIDVGLEDDYVDIVTLPGELVTEDGVFGIVTSPEETTPEDGYVGIVPPIGEIDAEDLGPITLNGEIVVNGEMLDGAKLPFVQETADGEVVMVPLRVVAEALGYDVSWNSTLRSVQLGVAIQLWIGRTEAHFGRRAPIELSAAPVIVDSSTFVPLDFFRNVLGQYAYVFEGQVVIETESDMY